MSESVPDGLTQMLTWGEIETKYGPLRELAPLPDGSWDVSALRTADEQRLLWTRVEPGLVSTGLHYVDREAYLVAAVPYGVGEEIIEVDPDIVACPECGNVYDSSFDLRCPMCEDDT